MRARKGWSPTFAARGAVFKAMAVGVGRRAGRLSATVAALAVLAVDAGAQAPDEAWRTLETEHFRVTFPAELEALARRTAARAERARGRLAEVFVEPPPGTIDILLSDHTDIANGNAGVTPSNRIRIFAQPPVDDPNLGFFDEWIDLVVTHELAHIYHLDRTGTLGRIVRSVVGRYPANWPVFPNAAAPRWTIEGLATWYESRLSDAGREHGTFHETVMRTAVLEGRFESFDQASGDSPVWPGGARSYLYGSEFFDHLLDTHGEERMAAFVDAVGGQWIPYRLDAAGRAAFGQSLTEAWAEWRAELEVRYADLDAELTRLGPVTEPEVVTAPSRVAQHARVSPDGARIAYARSDGRSDTQIREVTPDGVDLGKRTRASGIPTFDWLPGGDLIVAQFEQDGPYRVYSDLYRVDGAGEEHRLTEAARLVNPTLGPDGRIVAVQSGGGTTELVRVDGDGAVTPLTDPDPDVHWAFPTWSPDGRWIAASRWTQGAYLDVVVLDSSGREVARVTEDRAVDLAPTWSPDGRWLVWGSDRTGIQNLLAVPMDPATGRPDGPVRLATNVRTAVAYPDVDPAGRWIYVSAYHAEGWGIERVPFEPSTWPEAPAPVERFTAQAPPPDPSARAGGAVQDYSPARSLLPTYWRPLLREPVESAPVRTQDLDLRRRRILGYAVGAETSGVDLVGRHAYEASARIFVDDPAKTDLGASYSFAGLGNPVLGLAFRQLWDDDGVRVARPEEGAPLDTLFVLERSRSLSGSVTWLHQTIRAVTTVTASAGYGWDDRQLLDNALEPTDAYRLSAPQARVADTRLTVNWSRARGHAMQLGNAAGPAVFVRARRVHDLSVADSLSGMMGADRSVDEVLGQLRWYRTVAGSGFARHVLALRLAGGAARGPDADAGWFRAGGSTGSPEGITGLELFGGSSIFFGVRGYDPGARTGRIAWTGSAEYRVPLALVHRGLGAWPAYVDRVFGSVFVDAGNAWGPDESPGGFENARRSTLVGAGAEIVTDFLLFWTEPLRLRVGAAVPLVDGDGVRGYVRLGLVF